MMKLEIRTYGDPVLRVKAEPVKSVDEAVLELADDMLETMYASNGLGLAAQQVGRTEAICIIDVPSVEEGGEIPVSECPEMPLLLINPEITWREGADVSPEGCLSFPEIFAPVKRATAITVTYLDEHGARREQTVSGLIARAVQHELDHLNGVLLVDRMSSVKRVALSGKLKRLKNSHNEAD